MAYRIAVKNSAIKSPAKIPEPYFLALKSSIYGLAENAGPKELKN